METQNLTIRIDKELLKQVTEKAQEDNRTRNNYIVDLLKKAVKDKH